MSQTLDAVFKEGSFKPLADDSLHLYEGQRVRLTVEVRDQSKDDFFSKYQDAWRSPTNQTSVTDTLDVVLEAINVPRPLWDTLVDKFEDMRDFVLNRRPSETKKKFQEEIEWGLGVFRNVSTLFIYLVLLAIVLKFIGVWLLRTGKLEGLIASLGTSIILVLVVVVVVCLTSVQLLIKIASYIKAYRVPSIIGLWAISQSLVKTGLLLVTATNLSEMRTTLAQFVLGAFK